MEEPLELETLDSVLFVKERTLDTAVLCKEDWLEAELIIGNKSNDCGRDASEGKKILSIEI